MPFPTWPNLFCPVEHVPFRQQVRFSFFDGFWCFGRSLCEWFHEFSSNLTNQWLLLKQQARFVWGPRSIPKGISRNFEDPKTGRRERTKGNDEEGKAVRRKKRSKEYMKSIKEHRRQQQHYTIIFLANGRLSLALRPHIIGGCTAPSPQPPSARFRCQIYQILWQRRVGNCAWFADAVCGTRAFNPTTTV